MGEITRPGPAGGKDLRSRERSSDSGRIELVVFYDGEQ